ncbi:MAG: DNA-3-methyladenine glycosylase 2 family protein [Leptospiraceae bacterium]|nr:DNA-3-methyladenine glycosylase 2 family protein [Leptospiraceae bacterium]
MPEKVSKIKTFTKNERDLKLKKAVASLKSIDKKTCRLIDFVGECKLKPIGTPYYVIIKSIISQQLSTQAASSILKKINQYFDTENSIPKPEMIRDTSDKELRSCGLSFSKIETIKRISNSYSSGKLSDELLYSMSDRDVVNSLCEYKGIGPWTSEMVLIFGLDRWDHFSIGDLGLRKGVEKWYGLHRDDKMKIQKFIEKFSPYRSILSWYLWASFDTENWE